MTEVRICLNSKSEGKILFNSVMKVRIILGTFQSQTLWTKKMDFKSKSRLLLYSEIKITFLLNFGIMPLDVFTKNGDSKSVFCSKTTSKFS